jgi:hypothetical protein
MNIDCFITQITEPVENDTQNSNTKCRKNVANYKLIKNEEERRQVKYKRSLELLEKVKRLLENKILIFLLKANQYNCLTGIDYIIVTVEKNDGGKSISNDSSDSLTSMAPRVAALFDLPNEKGKTVKFNVV